MTAPANPGTDSRHDESVSSAWLVLGWIGGLVGYVRLRDTDRRAAKSFLVKGLVVSGLYTLVALVIVVVQLVVVAGVTREVISAGQPAAAATGDRGLGESAGAPAATDGSASATDPEGDGATYPGQPVADIVRLSLARQADGVQFTVEFAGPISGREAVSVDVAAQPSAVDDVCGASSVQIGGLEFRSAVVYVGCSEQGSLERIYVGDFRRSGGQVTTVVPFQFLPQAETLHARAAAFTVLTDTSATVVSDYAPDRVLPPLPLSDASP